MTGDVATCADENLIFGYTRPCLQVINIHEGARQGPGSKPRQHADKVAVRRLHKKADQFRGREEELSP